MANTTSRSEQPKRLNDLRSMMAQQGIDAWIVPSSDAHNSEYVASHWEGRAWLSGFTGSAGTVVVTQEKAALWTDGRYFLQAEEQLMGTGIELMKDGQPDVPTMAEWLTCEVKEKGVVGFDGAVLNLNTVRALENKLAEKSISLKGDQDLLDQIWNNRPSLPAEPVINHDLFYAGKSISDKLTDVREVMTSKKVSDLLITTLDDIAWLFNLRGSDIECNPVFLAYAMVSQDAVTLFTDRSRITSEAMQSLSDSKISLEAYDDIFKHLPALPETTTLLINPASTSYKLASVIPESVKKIEDRLPTTNLKAIKNSTEIERMKDCHRRDGVAMVRFMHWLETNIPTGKLDEVNIDEQLVQFRAEAPEFKGVSFPAIVGYAGHGAIIHYRADKDSAYNVKEKGLLLIDSGGQYPDGTTDITRTFACGELTEEEKRDYTLVMKSHIAMASAKFKAGTIGMQLDAITRQPMWAEGMDYNHGTGHGVGFFLNVHEGPMSVSPKFIDVALEPGMVITNEPGIYRDNKHGVRLENIMLVAEDMENDFGKFYKLIPMTLALFDTRPLLKDLMTNAEIKWLNGYHEMVREELSPELKGHDLEWLKEATKDL
ncbi:aminopeptidase P family protein [Endozoicomonas ascidiicola]|uniref:aminopeptidase P family protein n=1 Tax=Endozoicomonas ascidiicola TaxID=1698521 RepID=UPI00082F1E4B|nr:aminopeptidase P family protein [Endozoicomonas ascidiicola]